MTESCWNLREVPSGVFAELRAEFCPKSSCSPVRSLRGVVCGILFGVCVGLLSDFGVETRAGFLSLLVSLASSAPWRMTGVGCGSREGGVRLRSSTPDFVSRLLALGSFCWNGVGLWLTHREWRAASFPRLVFLASTGALGLLIRLGISGTNSRRLASDLASRR